MTIDQQYQATLDFLYAQLPMFHRIGAAAYKADLNNTYKLLAAVGNPHLQLKCVHIAGTNGKGSSSHLIAAALQANGYRTGLYTSPHLKDFRERIKVNGEMISREYVIHFIDEIKEEIKTIQPSFFELTVAMCFKYFAEQHLGIAIIETGLGGRLDSTNVITPLVSLITNISFDHSNLLGDTLEKIAGEKAGIIKKNVPIVISETSPIANTFIEKAKQENAEIIFADKFISSVYQKLNAENKSEIRIDSFGNRDEWNNQLLQLDLTGIYQNKNIKGVLCVINELQKQGFKFDFEKTKQGLETAKQLTGLSGRWDILNPQPFTVADIAHNEAGIFEIAEQLKNCSFQKLRIVFGAVKDKDVKKVLSLLPPDAIYYLCAPDLPRALPVDELLILANELKLNATTFQNTTSAWLQAKKDATADDMILITGSNFVVAEII